MKSDEAGCYHNSQLTVAARDVGERVGVSLQRYDFSEPQSGTNVCDRILCPLKGAIRRLCNEGHDVLTASDMHTALKERPVRGCTAAVRLVNETKKDLNISRKSNKIHARLFISTRRAQSVEGIPNWPWQTYAMR